MSNSEDELNISNIQSDTEQSNEINMNLNDSSENISKDKLNSVSFDGESNSFEKLSYDTKSKESDRRLSNHLIQLFVLNTILPMKLAYLEYSKKPFSEELFEMVREMASEKNNLITNFHNVGVVARDALESQALIELKNNYCAKKRCLQCAIGVKLLKR